MKKTNVRVDPKKLAIYAVDNCIAVNEDVQDRLSEGCGFFALVSKGPAGEMSISISVISPNNLKGETIH